MRRIKLVCFLTLLVVLGAMLVNCSSSDDTDEVADFIGTIIEVHPVGEGDVGGTILVEGEDTIQSSDKYVVTIKEETSILGPDGKKVEFADLKAGQQVEIWFSGAVAESYPAQVAAAKIMIVDDIGLGDEFQLAIGQRMELSDVPLEIVFKGLIGEDSRCAQDVTCVWQGEVSVDIEIIDSGVSHSLTLMHPGLFDDFSTDSYAGYKIAFKVLPYPQSEHPIADSEYRLVVIITEKDV